MGLAACANVPRRARCALLPLFFLADGQSHPGPAPLARCSRKTGGARTLCPVAAGGARWGRLCVNGWKNRLGAGARSASVSCSPCMAERSGLRARSELHGAGPEPIFPAKSEWSTVGASGDRHARAPTGHRLPRPPAKRQPSPQPSPGGRGSKESALGQRIGKYVVAGFRSERPMPTRGDQHVLAAIVTEVRHRRGLAARG
jgi:hypothetical protein